MAKSFRKFGHRERDYDRPNQVWHCGHFPEGSQCPLGPSDRGKCRGTGECLPEKKGDRWHCTRPPSLGGECCGGPSPEGQCGSPLAPCQPRLSLRHWRKRIGIGVSVFTVGLILILVAGKRERPITSSGQVTTAHSSEDMNCGSCHANVSHGLEGFVLNTSLFSNLNVVNSQLCLNCHGAQIGEWDARARFAHGWSQEDLGKHIEKADGEGSRLKAMDKPTLWVASQGSIRNKGITGELSCSMCHQEHHGPDFPLTKLTNEQCQVCHQNQFHSFEVGHPEFTNTDYPYSRRTRIYFDHESHYRKHFAGNEDMPMPGYDENQPFVSSESCTVCHLADEKGEFMRLRGYEASCAACHEESVKGGDPLTLMATPEIKEEAVKGGWPGTGYGLLPAMRFLLTDETRKELEVVDDHPEEDGSIPLFATDNKELLSDIAKDLREVAYSAWDGGTIVLDERMRERKYLTDSTPDGTLFTGLSVDTMRQYLFPGYGRNLGEIAFPDIDLDTLNAHLEKSGRSIGLWPERVAAPLSLFLQHILSHRPGIKDHVELLVKRNDEKENKDEEEEKGAIRLNDLTQATPEELEAVENIAWELKKLFVELQRNGAPFLAEFRPLRGGILDVKPTESVLDEVFVIAGKDDDFVAAIEKEIEEFSKGNAPKPISSAKNTKSETKPSKSKTDDDFGGDKKDDDFGDGKKDDDFGGDKKDDDFGSTTKDDDFGGGKKDDDFGSTTKDDDFGGGKKDDDFGSTTKDDDFGDGKKDDDFGSTTKDDDFGGDKKDDDFGSTTKDDDFGGDKKDDDFGGDEKEKDEKDSPESDKPREYSLYNPSAEEWQKAGGWFAEGNAIRYRSNGHADPVIRAWIDAAVAGINSDVEVVRRDWADVLSGTLQSNAGVDSNVSGKCFKCHTVEPDLASGIWKVNWFGAFATPLDRNPSSDLTRFSHAKHFIAIDCVSCHQPKEDGDYENFFLSRDSFDRAELLYPDRFSSNFQNINKQESCAKCHQESRAGNSCLDCHNYHSHVIPIERPAQ